MRMKFKVLVLIALAAILAIGSTNVFADAPRARVQDMHRTWEMLDLKFMLSPEFGLFTQPNVRTEHYRRDTYDPKTAQTSHNGQPLGVWFLELYNGFLYNLKVDDSLKVTFGADWYFNGSPQSDSKNIHNTRNNYPYEHAINVWAVPSYTIGDFTIMARIILYNQIFEGNTETWVLRTNADGTDGGSYRRGWDKSEEYGWAMTTRALVGLEYKLTKTATIFARYEIFYGTIADNETRFVPDNEQSEDPNKTTERNRDNNESRMAYGDGGFAKIGYYRNRAYLGYSLKLASNVSFINQYVCETNLNPNFDPDGLTLADRTQVTSIVHYVFIGASLTFNLY